MLVLCSISNRVLVLQKIALINAFSGLKELEEKEIWRNIIYFVWITNLERIDLEERDFIGIKSLSFEIDWISLKVKRLGKKLFFLFLSLSFPLKETRKVFLIIPSLPHPFFFLSLLKSYPNTVLVRKEPLNLKFKLG